MTVDVEATELHGLTLTQAGELIRLRHISPVEYVDALAGRIAALDGQIQAFLTPTVDVAREQALEAEREIAAGRYRGPLHGIPFALKDVFDTAGVLTTGHSRILEHHVPVHDATVTAKLRRAGAILMGKLALHEFAHGGPSFDVPWPPPRNPWDLSRVTGGSSSGSAAAIVAGLVPASIGTDTGGSIRVPASRCGVTGLMPTAGLVSRTGVIPHAPSFDRCGPMAMTVEDCAILLQVIAGYDPNDSGSVDHVIPPYAAALGEDLRGLRIGVLRDNWEREVAVCDEQRQAMDRALAVLTDLGAALEDCQIRPMQSYTDIKTIIAESEVFNIHHRELRTRPADFGADIMSRMLPAVLFSSTDLLHASREHQRIVAEMQPLYRQFDAFITVGSGEAPAFDAHDRLAFWKQPNHFTAANVTGQPVLALPNGVGPRGMPLGMQILGRPFGEETIIRIGHAYQSVTDWHRRRPRLTNDQMPPPVAEPQLVDAPSGDDPELRATCLSAARRAGLDLDDRMFAQLMEGAPYALAMAARIPRDHRYDEPPAAVFGVQPR